MKSNKKVLVILFIIIFALGTAGCRISSHKNNESTTKEAIISTFPEFNSKDTDDKSISSDIFKNKKLTLVNIWGSFCGPCIDELPELQQIYNEMKDKGVNVVGIVSDGSQNELDAINILKKKKVTFKNILPNKNLEENLLNKFSAVPVSILVDSNKKVIGDVIIGTRNKEQYKKIIEEALNKVR